MESKLSHQRVTNLMLCGPGTKNSCMEKLDIWFAARNDLTDSSSSWRFVYIA